MTNEPLALLDANIFVYSNHKESPFHKQASQILKDVMNNKLMACITPQVLWEFFAVVTDKRRFDDPLPLKTAINDVQFYWNQEKLINIFPGQDNFRQVLKLVEKYNVTGQHIHNVRLIATMLDNNVRVLYSGDTTLRKFKEIKVVNPFE